MAWRTGWLICLLSGCELLDPAPHDTGPRYIATGNHPAASSGGAATSGGASLGSSGASGVRGSSSSVARSSSTAAASTSLEPPTCAGGGILCDGTVKIRCDADGGHPVEDCHDTGLVCVTGIGCRLCQPGAATCQGNVSSVCSPGGAGFDDVVCDPVQGQSCNPDDGKCQGVCSATRLGRSYIGCDYFPTVTANVVETAFHFAVAVSNTTSTAADITVTQGSTTVETGQVAPHSVQVVQLPWVWDLKGPLETVGAIHSVLVPQGAYRLRSTQPVTVYQFNPLEYVDSSNNFSQTNDASLLLPTSAWTGSYLVVTLQSQAFFSGFYAVTANEDNTVVTVTPGPQSGVISPLAGLGVSGSGHVTLNAGDVVEVASDGSGFADVTGTLVTASKPVQVIAGHQCANIPTPTCCCDHLEESMFPLETLSKAYLVTAPLVPTLGSTPKIEWVRVVATQPATTLTYLPAQAGAPEWIGEAGGWIEIDDTAADFLVTADKPIMVMQYMEGQMAGGDTGDPAMALAVGIRQYRSNYLFHAPTNYESNFVNLVAATGKIINLDGAMVPLSSFTAIGSTGYGVARVALSNGGSGNHSVASSDPFGISVYGYGQYTSYWYPGGANLIDLLH